MKIIALFLALVGAAGATTRTSPTTSYTDVNNTLTACVSGDTLVIPAGSSTWATTLNVTGKALTIQGAGQGLTNITDGTSAGNGAIELTVSAATFVHLTGLSILSSGTTSANSGTLQIGATNPVGLDEVGFMVDHVTFNINSVVRGSTATGIYGVYADCNFIPSVHGSVHAIDVLGCIPGNDPGYTPWSRPTALGTNKAVYVERCTFDYRLNDQGDDCIDGYAGGRVVIRYNTFMDISQGFHGTDSGNSRSMMSFEIYNNAYTNSQSGLRVLTIRGGTGVIYSNTYAVTGAGGAWNATTIQYHRAAPADSNVSQWQHMGVSNWQLQSATLSANGAHICDVAGGFGFDNATNTTLGTFGGSNTTYFDGLTTSTSTFNGTTVGGYPGRDEPGWTTGPGPTGQTLYPIYIWLNSGFARANNADTFMGGNVPDEAQLAAVVQANREYYESTVRPGYTAYTYPYPGTSSTITPSTSMVGKSALIGKSKPL